MAGNQVHRAELGDRPGGGIAERLTVLAEAVGAVDEVVFAGGLLAPGALRERLRFRGPHAAHPVLGACQLAAESVGERLDQTWVEPNFGW